MKLNQLLYFSLSFDEISDFVRQPVPIPEKESDEYADAGVISGPVLPDVSPEIAITPEAPDTSVSPTQEPEESKPTQIEISKEVSTPVPEVKNLSMDKFFDDEEEPDNKPKLNITFNRRVPDRRDRKGSKLNFNLNLTSPAPSQQIAARIRSNTQVSYDSGQANVPSMTSQFKLQFLHYQLKIICF